MENAEGIIRGHIAEKESKNKKLAHTRLLHHFLLFINMFFLDFFDKINFLARSPPGTSLRIYHEISDPEVIS
jgi:hypothetical protein